MLKPKIQKAIKLLQLGAIFALSAAATLVSANQLTASVDRDHIGLQETFTLTLSADDKSQQAPDISSLKSDFDVLATSRNQSIRITNGRTESTTDWQITLAPKRAGKLLIPSFRVDDAVSDAIEIQVTEQTTTQIGGGDEPVQVEMEVEKTSVFVQEQLLVKLKLITQVNLSQAESQPLELKNALVVNLDQKQYQTEIGGKQHLIVETSYAVFPQQSGVLVIPSLTYNVEPSRTSRDYWNDPFGRRSNNLMRLRTEAKKITVKAAPDSNIASSWQPANNLVLNEGWSGSTDNLKVGEPITRTITIMADGLTGNQIAPLPTTQVDGLTFYPDQPLTKEDKLSKGVQGIRTETTAIIPSHGGSFTLPEVSVQWWDNASQTMKTASLPAKTLNVLGGNPAPVATSTADASSTGALQPTPPQIQIQPQTPAWVWAVIALLGVVVAGLSVYLAKLKNEIERLRDGRYQQAQADEALSEKERDIWNELQQAAAHSDAAALRKHILAWARFHWPAANIHTLDDLAKLADNAELGSALRQLDELLYSQHTPENWNAQELLQLLQQSRSMKQTRATSAGLEPLYPH